MEESRWKRWWKQRFAKGWTDTRKNDGRMLERKMMENGSGIRLDVDGEFLWFCWFATFISSRNDRIWWDVVEYSILMGYADGVIWRDLMRYSDGTSWLRQGKGGPNNWYLGDVMPLGCKMTSCRCGPHNFHPRCMLLDELETLESLHLMLW